MSGAKEVQTQGYIIRKEDLYSELSTFYYAFWSHLVPTLVLVGFAYWFMVLVTDGHTVVLSSGT
jgi:hypothetical protein